MEAIDLPKYGSIYGGEVSFATVEITGGGLDIEGVVGDDLEFGLFFDHADLTGYTFSGFVILSSSPLQRSQEITVTPVDVTVGLFTVNLSKEETLKIGPVSGRPWFLRWIEPGGKERSILMGKMMLSRY